MRTLSLGYSPCPNDTFIFHALATGAIPGLSWRPRVRMEDVETLNLLALSKSLDISKVSYGALPDLLDQYALLRSGGALGRGCGPLLVARPGTTLGSLARPTIAIPGRRTTANLLLRLYDPELPPGTPMSYADILPAVATGRADAGLIIHESRFTFPEHGLVELVDLGAWWETQTGLPIPLGGIVARRSLGAETLGEVEAAIRRSVEVAFADPATPAAYVAQHARELDPAVCQRHIDLYVNRFSLDLGDEGLAAVEELVRRAHRAGLSDAANPFAPLPQ
jgi:1,4-dihydroxy-6-naphthoate synthase